MTFVPPKSESRIVYIQYYNITMIITIISSDMMIRRKPYEYI